MALTPGEFAVRMYERLGRESKWIVFIMGLNTIRLNEVDYFLQRPSKKGDRYLFWAIRQMRYLILPLCSMLLLACSQVSEEESLYSQYELYREQAVKMHVSVIPEMLSSELRQKYKSSDESEFPILTSFYSVLHSVKDHYQSISGKKGCLTVNGFDEATSPVSLRIEYVHESNGWHLSYVEIFYLDAVSEFRASAVCPTKPPLMSEIVR